MLLKTYKGCNSRVISNLLTGDETWVHMFEPQRRADNKQWKRKDQKRQCIAKRTISSKKMLYAIFFNSSGPVVQVPCPSGHTVTGRFYKNSVLKKVKEFYNKKRPGKGWSGVHLLHDNASSHTRLAKNRSILILTGPAVNTGFNRSILVNSG